MKRPTLTLLSTLSIAIASALAWPAIAAEQPDPPMKLAHSQAGFHHFAIGDVELIALSDGTLPIPAEQLFSTTPAGEVAARLAAAHQGTHPDASINAYLIKLGERLVMIDAGAGELYGPNLNKITASLKAVGYTPEQVTDILVTHIHTDHTGGLMDGDRRVFPHATLHIERKEVDFWFDPAQREKAGKDHAKYFDEAAAKVGPYKAAGRVKTFSGATGLLPGIRSQPAPGHTPGHTFYVLESKGEKLVFWGDLLHVADVQFPRPDITIVFDIDPATAAMTRQRAFAEAARDGYWVAGDHVNFPGVGHLQADGTGYRWHPMPYVNDHYKAR
ncbi:MAG: MBL fold metallo-hydrolase [Rhizobacter sp.]|jgi:glyoxylase-like metal-dependent hydrolase (beta-lactamase superfamily II)